MIAWGFVPARGGSKSIPKKNLLPLAGRPLIDYSVNAALASGRLDRIICSTDDDAIAARAIALGIEVDRRPDDLATDQAKVDDVAKEWLLRMKAAGADLPEIVVLVQPTSPFVQPENVVDLVTFFARSPKAQSVHNVYRVPHNLHAWNQRSVDREGAVKFAFEKERSEARNKQDKPQSYAFGNLIAARTEALLGGRGFYAQPVYAIEIEQRFAFDLDSYDDIAIAEAMVASGVVPVDGSSPKNTITQRS